MTVTSPSPQTVAARAAQPARILLYSDNELVRNLVKDTIGDAIGAAGTPIEWTEVATAPIAVRLAQQGEYDLMILDNETSKLGGVGLVRELRAELSWQPTVLLLLAREQDAWLAAWSGADAAVLQPVDPFELVSQVARLLDIPEA
ncbi:MAG: hypothetical protein LBL01_06040 [Bifidobacteriaceae bacterium]|jgi:DNA-binding response OmpR family regulator|nr:hypothetical protein [Bifidobacteriaceae bacterium]